MTSHGRPSPRDSPGSLLLPIIGVIIIAAVVAAAATWAGWYFLLNPRQRHPLATPSDFINVVKIGLAIAAGLGGASALVVAYRKQKTAEHTYELSRHAQRLSELSAARDVARRWDERFDMAVSQLGCQDSPAVRLSGIYSLATLADDWEDGRQRCVSVLTAYLRLPFLPGETNIGEIEVRNTVLTVVREHLQPDAVASWDGMLFDLTGATLHGGSLDGIELKRSVLNFGQCTLIGGTMTLRNAVIDGGGINFAESTFNAGTIFAEALRIKEGTIDFSRSTFSGARLIFKGGGVWHGDGRLVFNQCLMSGGMLTFGLTVFVTNGDLADAVQYPTDEYPISLKEAAISGGLISFTSKKIVTSFLEVRPPDDDKLPARASAVDFTQMHIADGTIEFHNVELCDALLDFGGATLSGGRLDFKESRFTNAHVNFGGAEFSGADVSFFICGFTYERGDRGQLGVKAREWIEKLERLEVEKRDMVYGPGIRSTFSATHAKFLAGKVDFTGVRLYGTVLEFHAAEFRGGELNLDNIDGQYGVIDLWRARFEYKPLTIITIGNDLSLFVVYSQHEDFGPIGKIEIPKYTHRLQVSPRD